MTRIQDVDFNEVSAYNITEINPEDIAGYIIQRSPTSNFLFNAYAVSQDDELLFCAASDLSFEKAMAFVEAINQEHYPTILSPTDEVLKTLELINKQ